MNIRNLTIWILRLVPALILLQTLYFKFTAQPESVRLFTVLGMEPYGRIGTGILELIAGDPDPDSQVHRVWCDSWIGDDDGSLIFSSYQTWCLF